MHLTIDIGNSHSKAALFDEDGTLVRYMPDLKRCDASLFAEAKAAAVCASGTMPDLGRWLPRGVEPLVVDASTPLPIKIDYDTPATLGADRIAAACGAYALFGGQNCMIIDSGTCVTIDFLDADGIFHGGAIMPGVDMQFRAMNTFTARLPLIESGGMLPTEVNPCGRSTREAMCAGVMSGLMYAVEGFARHYTRLYGRLTTVSTVEGLNATAVEPHLVMKGLNSLLMTRRDHAERERDEHR